MRRLQAWLEAYLGVAGVAGAALLAGSVAFYCAGLLPAETKREQLRAELARAAATKTPVGGARQAEQALAGFYGNLGARREAPAALRALFDAAASEALVLETGEYRLLREPGAKLARYQIVLPVKGSYVAIRRFVVRALNDVPGLALDSLELRRESTSSHVVEARVQLTLYLVAA
jgi:hypothetical protein